MAHSALVSLMNTLEPIVQSDRFPILHMKQHILTLYRKVRFLQNMFQDCPQKSNEEEMNSFEIRIRDAAYATEDMIEFDILEQVHSELIDSGISSDMEYQDLDEAIMEVDSIVMELLNDSCGLKYLLPRKYNLSVGSSRRPVRSGNVTMVGMDEDLIGLKDRLTGYESKLQMIPIVGMGGIGKTTLARNLYDDSLIRYHFDVHAWVTISQTYLVRDVLQCLLNDVAVETNKDQEKSIQDLAQSLYKTLIGRRYLIVLDDVWSTNVWDDLRRMFPEDFNGSRIMLTTRLMEMAVYTTDSSSPPHRMRLLDEDKSWELLCREVFGQESCPPEFEELEDVGKIIAHNSRGLPLATSVIGGLLANSNMTREYWEYVAQNVNSMAIENDYHCSEILSLSFDHLPHHLQPCFLYFGVFPEDYEIPVTKLIKLWIAEGFLNPIASKGLEDVADEYLNILINRNLISVRSKGSNGKMKTCGIHDLLRDLCIREAQKENFLHIISGRNGFPPDCMNQRRLIMHSDIMEDSDITDDVHSTMELMTLTRSLLCTGRILSKSPFYQRFILLRVLDILGTELLEFPFEILMLVNLRYLALSFSRFYGLPSELSLLWKLQILIIQDHQNLLNRQNFPYFKSYCEVYMPQEILDMTQLRHLQMTECFFPNDVHDSVVLKNVQTLSTLANFRFTEEFLKKFPNLQKLVVYYYAAGIGDWSDYHLKNLVRLHKLENLKCIFNWPPNETLLLNLSFPKSLKKLTLSGSKLSWEDMRIIGSLLCLEVLKLKEYAFLGPVWEPVEGEFRRLKFLKIERTNLVRWIAEDTHFPCLEHLVIRQCFDLETIPSSFGEIATLKVIDIDDCSSSAVASVEQILEEQRSLENLVLQVHVRR